MADITTLTTGAADGTGYFDKLMAAIDAQLTTQLDLGRIQQKDFATVYLGAMQSALAQAVQYAVVVEQIAASQSQTSVSEAQSAKDLLVKQQQIDASVSDVTIAENQSAKDLLLKQGQIDKLDSDVTVQEEQSTKDLLVKAQQIAASEDKTLAEVNLLTQKLKTEKAQIEDTVDAVTVAGAVGTQKDLQEAQANAFVRDGEQKALKILMDSWNISKSVTGDSLDIPDGARNDDIEDMIIKLRQGINITSSIYKFNADAGPDQSVTASSYVELDGSGSTAPWDDSVTPEEISTYAWAITLDTTGAPPTLINGTTARPTFVAPSSTGYTTFRLTITGSLGSTSYDYVTITVE